MHLNSDLRFIIPVVTATVAVDSNGGEEDEENEVDNPEEVGVHLEYNQIISINRQWSITR